MEERNEMIFFEGQEFRRDVVQNIYLLAFCGFLISRTFRAFLHVLSNYIVYTHYNQRGVLDKVIETFLCLICNYFFLKFNSVKKSEC